MNEQDNIHEQSDSLSPDNEVVIEEKPQSGSNIKTEVYEWLQCGVVAILACILLFVFGARNIVVVGISMENTLHKDDRIIISNLFYTPKQGDIVVLRKDTFYNEPIVKRVIATEGQTIDIDFETGDVTVDGVLLIEKYIAEPTFKSHDFIGPVTVPEGHIFVMGDNRNHSNDSRDARLGIVDERYIIGKMLFRLWPIGDSGKAG